MRKLAKLKAKAADRSVSTTHLSTENTRAILPMARILLRITSLRRLAAFPVCTDTAKREKNAQCLVSFAVECRCCSIVAGGRFTRPK